MLEVGTIGYVVDINKDRPIRAVRVSSDLAHDEWGNTGYIADFLEIREHRLVYGIPIAEFEGTKWQKIPKQYRNLDPQKLHNALDPVVWRFTEKENELLGKFLRYNNPKDIEKAYAMGLMVEKEKLIDWVIEFEINRNNEYRFIKKIPEWTISYGKDKRTYIFMPESEIYLTFEDARAAKKKIEEARAKEASLSDRDWSIRDFERLLTRQFPESEWDGYRKTFIEMPDLEDVEVRKHLGKMEYRRYGLNGHGCWSELKVAF